MNYIGHTVIISLIRNNPDMILENHNIPALPLIDIINICCKRNRRMGKIHFQIIHSPEINVNIRLLYVVILRMRIDIFFHQFHEIIAGASHCICHKICTDAILVVRISCRIIFTFIDRFCGNILSCALENIRLIVNPVSVLIHRTVDVGYTEVFILFRLNRRTACSDKKITTAPGNTPGCSQQDQNNC